MEQSDEAAVPPEHPASFRSDDVTSPGLLFDNLPDSVPQKSPGVLNMDDCPDRYTRQHFRMLVVALFSLSCKSFGFLLCSAPQLTPLHIEHTRMGDTFERIGLPKLPGLGSIHLLWACCETPRLHHG